MPAILILIAAFFEYHKIRKSSDSQDKRGWGIVWLILALIVWTSASLLKYCGLLKYGEFSEVLFSIGNSVLLLASFPYFKYRWEWFDKKDNLNTWYSLLATVFTLFVFGSFIINSIVSKASDEDAVVEKLILEKENIGLKIDSLENSIDVLYIGIAEVDKKINDIIPLWQGSLFDIFLTIMTLIPLGFLLYKNFSRRGMRFIGMLAWITILLQLIVQSAIIVGFFDATNQILTNDYFNYTYVVSFFSLALIFVALAFSAIVDEVKEENKEAIDELKQESEEKIINIKKEYYDKDEGKVFRDKLSNFDIEEVIFELREYTEIKGKSKEHQAITNISSKYQRLKQDLRIGTIGPGNELGVEYAQIVNSLYEVINDLFGKV